MTSPSSSAQRWADELGQWAVPPQVLAQATQSPWGFPVQRFVRRTRQALAAPSGWSFERAASALDDGASLLDVGAGAGAASLPLARRLGQHGPLTAVDSDAAMLRALDDLAADPSARVACRVVTVQGTWPDDAGAVHPHDVVVCHHVVYNVSDVGAFADALTDHARRRVVVELPPQHPLSWMSPLWQQFWQLSRPTGPTADDFVQVVRDCGARDVVVHRWQREDVDETPFHERVALVTRRLCLPDERRDEVVEQMQAGPPQQRRDVVTVSWSGRA